MTGRAAPSTFRPPTVTGALSLVPHRFLSSRIPTTPNRRGLRGHGAAEGPERPGRAPASPPSGGAGPPSRRPPGRRGAGEQGTWGGERGRGVRPPPPPGTKGPGLSRAVEHNKGARRPRDAGRPPGRREGGGRGARAGRAAPGAGGGPAVLSVKREPGPQREGPPGPTARGRPPPRANGRPLLRRERRCRRAEPRAAPRHRQPPAARSERGKGEERRGGRPDLAELLAVLGGRLHGGLGALPQPRLKLQQALPQAPQLQQVAAETAALLLGLLVRHLRTPLRRVRSPPSRRLGLPPPSSLGYASRDYTMPRSGEGSRAGEDGRGGARAHYPSPRGAGFDRGGARAGRERARLRASRDATPRPLQRPRGHVTALPALPPTSFGGKWWWWRPRGFPRASRAAMAGGLAAWVCEGFFCLVSCWYCLALSAALRFLCTTLSALNRAGSCRG